MFRNESLVLHPGGRVEIVAQRLADPAPGWAIVEVTDSGVCGGDIAKAAGRQGLSEPEFIGHEPAGVVVKVGPAVERYRRDNPFADPMPELVPGDRVVGWTIGGALSRYVHTETALLRRVPEKSTISYWSLWGEPLSCMVGALDGARIAQGDDVLVVGAGFMGLLGIGLAAAHPTRFVIAAARGGSALSLVGGMGASDTLLLTGREAAVRELLAITGGSLADVSIEVTGAGEPYRLVHDTTRPHGTIVIAGYHTDSDRLPDGTRTEPGVRWHDEERADFNAHTVVRGHTRDLDTIMRNMERGLRLVEAEQLNTAHVESHVTRVPWNERAIQEAFDAAVRREAGHLKLVVLPGTTE